MSDTGDLRDFHGKLTLGADLPSLPEKPAARCQHTDGRDLFDEQAMDTHATAFGRACIGHVHKRVLQRIDEYIANIKTKPMLLNEAVSLAGLQLALAVEFEMEDAVEKIEKVDVDQAVGVDLGATEVASCNQESQTMSTTPERTGQPFATLGSTGQGMRCWCERCRPVTIDDMRMVICPSCGDKRCVHARDHEAPCAKDDLFAHNAWVEKHLVLPQAVLRHQQDLGNQPG